jgi:membrane-bound lytic murein transglycosylase D
MDISLLPLLESGFNPYAVSKSRAAGLWQFIRGTSVKFGLKTDRWIDERRDIEKSTQAAINHLKNLYTIFNNWELTLAAYNGGAGHVKRSMQKTGKSNFWELRKTDSLSKETNEYVARFAALLIIYKNQEVFDLHDELNLIEHPETEKIVLEYPVNINHISKISGTSIGVLRELNPQLKRNLTPPYYKQYTLRLPIEAKKRLKKKQNNIYRIKFARLKSHIVREGECIYKIARRYRIKPISIIMLNDLKNPHLIRPGFKLYIPI